MKLSLRRGSIWVAIIMVVGLLATLGLSAAGTTSVTSGDGIEPEYVSGNPACGDIGYDFGFKVNGSPNGTFYLSEDGELTGGAPEDDTNYVTISNSDGTYFDWMASLGIDAVIVKGGPNANAYIYTPEDTADTHLTTPINPANGQPYGISHIEFCYDYEVDVSKTADTSYTRTFGWTIDKSVTPETWDLFTGDSGTSEYTVAVIKDSGNDSDWAVEGNITIENNTPFDATIESATDVVSPDIAVAVDCGEEFPYSLVAGDILTCTYSSTLPDGTARTNTATVTTSGDVGGNMATADVTFGEPTTVVNDTINVTDYFTDEPGMDLGSASDDFTFTYGRRFTCPTDESLYDNGVYVDEDLDNFAQIDETGAWDDADVTMTCYMPLVSKDAETSFTRTWNWSIDKTGDQTELTLSVGQQFLVNYEVTVDAVKTDSDHAVIGKIWVHNPAPIDAVLNGVSDVVSPDIVGTVDCGTVTFPYTLVADDTLECSYTADLPNATTRTNTATATLQNYDYDPEEVATADGTTDFTGTANVVFSSTPNAEYDECIDVSDDKYGDLGNVCASEVPKTLNYSMYVGPYETCGFYEYTNVASFVTNDTATTGSDDHTVNVTVPCGGCTLTPGYWKTHSTYGPAPYDDTWALLEPNAEASPFFLSGQSYYEVLWTAPKGGNPYYILAHAYIAAELNFLNGAGTTPEAIDAFDAATELFEGYAPDDAAALKGRDKTAWIELAEFLDDYNNGLIGPGHCTE